MLSPAQMLDKVAVGNDAGWALAFHHEVAGQIVEKPDDPVFTRDDYYAEITASLPPDLSGGTYTFVVEGLTDDDYRKIAQTDGKGPSVVRLYLYWRDTASSPAYFASVAGVMDLFGGLKEKAMKEALVAELSVVKVSRKAGTRRYETTITAR